MDIPSIDAQLGKLAEDLEAIKQGMGAWDSANPEHLKVIVAEKQAMASIREEMAALQKTKAQLVQAQIAQAGPQKEQEGAGGGWLDLLVQQFTSQITELWSPSAWDVRATDTTDKQDFRQFRQNSQDGANLGCAVRQRVDVRLRKGRSQKCHIGGGCSNSFCDYECQLDPSRSPTT
eukprot:TRINITY_DN66972_c0_g1_i1.p1 TRINITY_DN66972_c0_g1~~TRINITY_DN66972_c0_g1_i1.p1  ORF type:complete len:176 (-),score=4.20 TRINITY_DN66972_c0_g1_i1:211-738(-)